MNPHKTAIVTGANSGIGAEIALKLAKEDIGVVVHYLEKPVFKVSNNTTFEHTESGKQKALEICDTIRKEGGQAEIFGGDLAETDTLTNLVCFTEETFGIPTILVKMQHIVNFRIIFLKQQPIRLTGILSSIPVLLYY